MTICSAYSLKLGCSGLVEGHRLAGDDVLERAALPAGEHRLVDRPWRAAPSTGCTPPRGPRSVLCVVNVTMSAKAPDWVRAAGDQAGEVRGIEQEQRTDLVGDRPERLRVEPSRIAGGAGDDHLRPMLEQYVICPG